MRRLHTRAENCHVIDWKFEHGLAKESYSWLAHHVGGEVQKNILLVLLLAPAKLGEYHSSVSPKRLVARRGGIMFVRS